MIAAERLEDVMVSDSVTRIEVYQQLIRAKNESGIAECLHDALFRDLKDAVSRSPTHDHAAASASLPTTVAVAASTDSPHHQASLSKRGNRRKRIAVSSISGQLARHLLQIDPNRDGLLTAAAAAAAVPAPGAVSSGSIQSIQSVSQRDVVDHGKPVHHQTQERLLKELEDFRSESGYLGVVILGICNNDPDHIERDIVLYFPDLLLLDQVIICNLLFSCPLIYSSSSLFQQQLVIHDANADVGQAGITGITFTTDAHFVQRTC